MVRSTVVQGLKAPLAAASAITMAVSAPVTSACPHKMPPVRHSSGENGKRSLANSAPMASTLRPLAKTQGAKFCARMALAASQVSWGMGKLHRFAGREAKSAARRHRHERGSYTRGRQTATAGRGAAAAGALPFGCEKGLWLRGGTAGGGHPGRSGAAHALALGSD